MERDERIIILGMFREQLNHRYDEGPTLLDRLYPDILNWILNYADWTRDSTCYTFTSCSCGIPGRMKDYGMPPDVALPRWVPT